MAYLSGYGTELEDADPITGMSLGRDPLRLDERFDRPELIDTGQGAELHIGRPSSEPADLVT
jgi:hypothetical protein